MLQICHKECNKYDKLVYPDPFDLTYRPISELKDNFKTYLRKCQDQDEVEVGKMNTGGQLVVWTQSFWMLLLPLVAI